MSLISSNARIIDGICGAAAMIEAAMKNPDEEDQAVDEAAKLLPPELTATPVMVINWNERLRFLLTKDHPPRAETRRLDESWTTIPLTEDQEWGLAIFFDRTLADEPGMPPQRLIR